MTIKIVRSSNNFLLVGGRGGISLTIDCSKQLAGYNADRNLLNADCDLLAGFSTAHDVDSLPPSLIDSFNRHCGLQRRPVFKGEQFAPILAQHLDEIRDLPEASVDSIDIICNKFEELREVFSQDLKRRDPLPDVSLSKLLHFVHPVSFWILDSRVMTVLDIWGYSRSFSGFGRLLDDLFRVQEFEGLRAFLEQKNTQLIGNHPLNSLPCSFLKILDKVLWFTGD